MPNVSLPKIGMEKPEPLSSSGSLNSQPSQTWNGDIPNKVLAWCQAENLIAPGDKILCAVSGGKDSMVMLDLLQALRKTLRLTLQVAHYHHGLRGEEADRDAAFVQAYCKEHHIPFQCGHGQVAAVARETGQSIEQAARSMRYAFLLDAAKGCKIATAHSADDYLETFLLNLMRGTGLRGLCSIPAQRATIIRPVLCLDRQEISQWQALRQVPYVEDSSNQTRVHFRNCVRQDVLPALLALCPQLPHALVAHGQLLQQDADYLDARAAELLAQASQGAGLDVTYIHGAAEAIASRALLQWLRDAGIAELEQVHVQSILQLCHTTVGTAQLSLPGNYTVLREYQVLQLCRTNSSQVPSPVAQVLPVPGEILWGDWHIVASLIQQWDGKVLPDTWMLRPTSATLTIRSCQSGDRLRRPGGSKSIRKLMIDHKIPRTLRDQLPVLCCEDGILGAALLGASSAYYARPGQSALCIHMLHKKGKEVD